MSKNKSSGIIAIGNLIFWGGLAYTFFGADGDKEEKKVEKPKDEKPAIVEQTKDVLKSIQKETKDAINIAKKILKQSIDDFKEDLDEEKVEEKSNEKKEEKAEEDLLKIIDKDTKIKCKPTFRKL